MHLSVKQKILYRFLCWVYYTWLFGFLLVWTCWVDCLICSFSGKRTCLIWIQQLRIHILDVFACRRWPLKLIISCRELNCFSYWTVLIFNLFYYYWFGSLIYLTIIFAITLASPTSTSIANFIFLALNFLVVVQLLYSWAHCGETIWMVLLFYFMLIWLVYYYWFFLIFGSGILVINV